MQDITIEIRRARLSDAEALSETHDLAWRTAYQEIIPGPELDKLINRRGAEWWEGAIRKGSRISILAFGDTVAGYTNYGRNRALSLAYHGEIYELYFRPEFRRRGFGRRLFEAVRHDLAQSGYRGPFKEAGKDSVAYYPDEPIAWDYINRAMPVPIKSLVVWALSDNTPAVAFFRALGGRPVARSNETFGNKTLDKIAYAWS